MEPGDSLTPSFTTLGCARGVKIKTIGNYQGDKGLRVNDLPETKTEGRMVEFEVRPTLVVVRRELSKSSHQNLTFLGEEGCGYLKDYREAKMREGEELTPESAIVATKLRDENLHQCYERGRRHRAGYQEGEIQMGALHAKVILRHQADASGVEGLGAPRLSGILDGPHRRHRIGILQTRAGSSRGWSKT